MTVLLREAIGDRLRHARTNQRRTLRDISRAARVSLGYLSEVERGQKEASSELLASICGALELPLAELLHTVASDISSLEALDTPALDAPTLDTPTLDSKALDSKALDSRSMRTLEESRLPASHPAPSVPTRRSAMETSAVEANTFSGRVVSGKPHSSSVAGAVAPTLRTTIKPPKLATSAA